MSQISIKCASCGNDVVFAEDPYSTVGATKYWKSTYDEPKKSQLIVQRKIPSVNKKGKMTVRVMDEHVLASYCGAQCGLDDYGTTRD